MGQGHTSAYFAPLPGRLPAAQLPLSLLGSLMPHLLALSLSIYNDQLTSKAFSLRLTLWDLHLEWNSKVPFIDLVASHQFPHT